MNPIVAKAFTCFLPFIQMPMIIDLQSPQGRRDAERRVYWKDHGILRSFWTNFSNVAEGVYRSNHPDYVRLESYRDMGINSVLNLRGTPQKPHYLLEVENCNKLDLSLKSISLSARHAPQREKLMAVFAAFESMERPFLMHCKSGADRTGLVAALYLLNQGEPAAVARRQLTLRHLHLKFSRTGIQDHLLDLFEARLEKSSISIKDWVANEYDAVKLSDSFSNLRRLPI